MAWDDSESDADVLDVKANWDDDEEDETELAKKVESITIAPKKQTLTQKIAARTQQDLVRKQPESMHATKAREKAEIDFENLENARDLFGVNEPKTEKGSDIFYSSAPRTKAEFDVYTKHVVGELLRFQEQSQYAYFVESLVRELCGGMLLEDTRKVSTVISALINDKQKKTKKGPVKKAQLQKSSAPDTEDIDQYAGDYDDFM